MAKLYDRNFAIAFVGQTCFVLANSCLTHYARWIVFLGGDVGDVGWINGAGPILGLLLRPWIGQWIDRVGPRTTCALGCGLFALSVLGNLLIHKIGFALYVLRAASVVGAAVFFASSLTYITKAVPPERRTEAIGTLGAGGFAGMLLGPLLGDLFLSKETRSRGDFAGLFISAAISVVASLLLLALQRPAPRSEHASPIRLRLFAVLVRTYWPGSILFVNFVFGVCMTVPLVFLARFVDVVGLNTVWPFFLAYAGWGLFVRVGLRRLPERLGDHRQVLLGLLLLGVGMFSFLWVDETHVLRLVVPAILCGTGHALLFHTMIALSLAPFPPEARGAASVLALMSLDLGTIGGAPPLGMAAKYLGDNVFAYHCLFATVGTLCLIAALMNLWRNTAAKPLAK